MQEVFYLVVAAIGAGIHLLVRRRALTSLLVVEILLLWALVVLIGLGGIVATGFHVFDAAQTARMIGWQPGSPFQFENAMGDLAFGVLAILCIWIRRSFWLATGLGSSIQLLGDAYGHVYQLVVHGDHAPDNSGLVLYADFAFPILILVLLLLWGLLLRRTRVSG